MKKFLLTMSLVAVTAISMAACDNKDDETAATEPATGESTVMSAPTNGATTTTTVTTETTTPAEPAQGIAVGEPNPATPDTQTTTCGDHADLIGKNISDIDQASFGKPVRVLYPDSAATMDFNPDRINIILDKDTDTVTEVRCG